MVEFKIALTVASHRGDDETVFLEKLCTLDGCIRDFCKLLGCICDGCVSHAVHCFDCDEVRQIYIPCYNYKISRTVMNILSFHYFSKLVESYSDLLKHSYPEWNFELEIQNPVC